jgi:Tfp pilus assembly protein PilF
MKLSSMSSRLQIYFVLLCFLVACLPGRAQSTPSTAGGDPLGLDSRDLQLRKQSAARERASVPRGYAVVIGVGRYEKLDPSQYLRFSETDAEAVYRVLISQQGGAFPAENVHKLIGQQATLSNVRHELEAWLPSVAKEQDRVVVYFAGHGFVKEGRGFIAPYDVDTTSVETTAYPMNDLGTLLATNVKARWKVLLTDACHSGKITPETTDEAVDEQFRGLPPGFLILSATRERERGYEDPNLSTGFGVFSYFLVEGLQGNADDSPCDGVITADELIEYVRSGVKSYTRTRGVVQTPTDHGDFDNNMILGVNPQCSNSGAGPAAALGGIVVEANIEGVEIYLDDRLVGTAVPGKALSLPGLSTGIHVVRGVKSGYEPDTKEIMVVPGQEKAVSLRIQYRREVKRSARELVDRGEALLYKSNSGFNPLTPYLADQQTQADLKKARNFFTLALKEDTSYPTADFDLAISCQLLSDDGCMMDAFRKAMQLDPAYTEARVQFAGALIESGDPDEAIRQLTDALRIDPNSDVAYSHMARAYLDKGVWSNAIDWADKAISSRQGNDQAYLWKADALRHAAATTADRSDRPARYEQSIDNYRTYLRLTNFRTPAAAKMAYYLIGFGLGSRGHADRKVVYEYQHSLAFMGLCECEERLGNLQRAADYCQNAIKQDPNEPLARFLLGNVYRDLFNSTKTKDYLLAARANYSKMVEINPDLDLAQNARNYISQIDNILRLVN